MTKNINLPNPEQLANDFAEEVWQEYNNTVTDDLFKAWAKLFSQFNKNIEDNQNGSSVKTKTVIPMPTGTGKSLAMRYYLRSLPEEIGALVISFFIEECNDIAEIVNAFDPINKFKEEQATQHLVPKAAVFSSNIHPSRELAQVPILVISHNKLIKSINDESKINALLTLNNSKRKLIIIDEEITQIDDVQISKSDIDTLISTCMILTGNGHGSKELKEEIKYLKDVLEILGNVDHSSQYGTTLKASQVKKIRSGVASDLSTLGDFVYEHKHNLIKKYNKSSVLGVLKDILQKMKALRDNENIYSTTLKNKVFINGSSRINFPHFNSVILDATSTINYFYSVNANTQLINIDPNIRSYKNVTIHISKEKYRLGKESLMTKSPKDLIDALTDVIQNVNPRRLNGNPLSGLDGQNIKSMLVIFNKAIEERFKKLRLNFEDIKGNSQLTLDHWGNLTGKNNYKDVEIMMILGLPSKPNYHITNLHLASDREIKALEDINTPKIQEERNNIKNSLMASEIVQAINRIQCRKINDDQGNCPDTDIYLFQPAHIDFTTDLLPWIKRAMPGVKCQECDALRLPNSLKPKRSNEHGISYNSYQKFVKYIHSQGCGTYKTSDITEALGVDRSVMTKINKRIVQLQSGEQHPIDDDLLDQCIINFDLKLSGGNKNKSITIKSQA